MSSVNLITRPLHCHGVVNNIILTQHVFVKINLVEDLKERERIFRILATKVKVLLGYIPNYSQIFLSCRLGNSRNGAKSI